MSAEQSPPAHTSGEDVPAGTHTLGKMSPPAHMSHIKSPRRCSFPAERPHGRTDPAEITTAGPRGGSLPAGKSEGAARASNPGGQVGGTPASLRGRTARGREDL